MHPLITTADGSHTLFAPHFNEHYHSIHGAIQESQHVFIEAGYQSLPNNIAAPVNILEMGFGTGLNAFLTYMATQYQLQSICYTAIEAYPLLVATALLLNYPEQLQATEHRDAFADLHRAIWNKAIQITPNFVLYKQHADLLTLPLPNAHFHLIYYDAFAPTSQPELWTTEVFAKLYDAMQPNGILVTYCAKGSVKRALKAVGFSLESLPGPHGKREITRAHKPALSVKPTILPFEASSAHRG